MILKGNYVDCSYLSQSIYNFLSISLFAYIYIYLGLFPFIYFSICSYLAQSAGAAEYTDCIFAVG